MGYSGKVVGGSINFRRLQRILFTFRCTDEFKFGLVWVECLVWCIIHNFVKVYRFIGRSQELFKFDKRGCYLYLSRLYYTHVMMPFEKDKKELLIKLKEITEDYMDTVEADLRYIPAKRKMRELKKVVKAIDKWKVEL